MSKRILFIYHVLAYFLASIIILAALLVSLSGFLTPALNEHKADFEKIASKLLQAPVQIGRVRVDWQAYAPQISLDHLAILDPDTQKPKLVVEAFRVDFSILKSLFERRLEINKMTVSGVKLRVDRDTSGTLNIAGLGSYDLHDTMTGASVEADKIEQWVFSQPLLVLENIDLFYTEAKTGELSLSLKDLSLQNTTEHHVIDGIAVLNQALPTKVELHFAWDGDVKKIDESKGHFYIYLEGLSLSQWLGQFSWEHWTLSRGMLSAKVWANWEGRAFSDWQSEFQIYDLNLYSPSSKRRENIDRLSAHLGWKREGDMDIYAADNVLINFPHHLWPVTSFMVKLKNAGNQAQLQELKISYLDLVDVYRFMQLMDVHLPDELALTLHELDPKGALSNFDVSLNPTVKDYHDIHLQTEFEKVTLNAWKNYPFVNNVKGDFTWDGSAGQLNIKSDNVLIQEPDLFPETFYFKNCVGQFHFSEDAQGVWNLDAKAIRIMNEDLSMHSDFHLAGTNFQDAKIDLQAGFQVDKAARIAAYLPSKIFDPDLQKWLKGAFLGGSLSEGRVVLRGNFKNFPFDHQEGEFLISTNTQDIDFQFAPAWPLLRKLSGNIVYAGRAMDINIDSGSLEGITLSPIHARIPYFGNDAPQILSVDAGWIKTDFSNAMTFVHSSPLETSLGQDLAGMELTGPIQLKLDLVVPLKKPEGTQVKGEVKFDQTLLNLPQWKLSLSHLQGGFQFTEDILTANDIVGDLFNSPINLKLTTVVDKNHVPLVRADLSGKIRASSLADWTKLSLDPYLQGESNFKAILFLASHAHPAPTVFNIQSDLQGMSLNVPAPFGKNKETARAFNLNLNFDSGASVTALASFEGVWNAGLLFHNTQQDFVFQSGELQLGSGPFQWKPGDPGLLVSGKMKLLDIPMWQNYFAKVNAGQNHFNGNLSLFRGLNVDADLINALGQSIHAAHLEMSNDKKNWIFDIRSQEIAGRLVLPFQLQNDTVQGRFQYIRLNTSSGKPTEKLDPRNLPAMQLSSDAVQFAGKDLGRVKLTVQPNQSGLDIKQLSIEKNYFTLQAEGSWTQTFGKSFTHLQGEMSSPRVDQALKAWGLGSTNFIGSTGNLRFDLAWGDTPYQVDLSKMTGQASLSLGEGRIIQLSDTSDAKMGLGRLLNIFSLSTIPRRLSLDFSDLVEKGYSFDSLKGNFNLQNGNAQTKDMRFEGPVALVAIEGRVGLVKKDFDMRLYVTPHVTSSLPVVATIAGGPLAGVATWVVDKMISREVSQATTYRYTVTGPWDQPVWQELTQGSVKKVSSIKTQ